MARTCSPIAAATAIMAAMHTRPPSRPRRVRGVRRAAVPVLALAGAAACSSTRAGAPTRPGPEIAIPSFARDDARVGTAGFVRETLRLSVERGERRCTLMTFVVGDELTLGAMVRGAFAGEVVWDVNGRAVRSPFDSKAPGRAGPATVDGRASDLRLEGAAVGATTWANFTVPCAEWLPDGAALSLSFVADGEAVTLPDAGVHYVARFSAR